jgi:hypothetical protein
MTTPDLALRESVIARAKQCSAALAGIVDDARRAGFSSRAVARLLAVGDAASEAAAAIRYDSGLIARAVEACELARIRIGYIGGAAGAYFFTEADWRGVKDEVLASGTNVVTYSTIPPRDMGPGDPIGYLYGCAVFIDAGPSRFVRDDGDRGKAEALLSECVGYVFDGASR